MPDPLFTLATLAGARLKARGLKLVTAESCTGGWVAEAVTAIPGSSDWFERGFVTYSNEAKREMLGVRTETLDRAGAVSEETALEMARGALAASRAQVAVSITGVAGPTGGTATKPVGNGVLRLGARRRRRGRDDQTLRRRPRRGAPAVGRLRAAGIARTNRRMKR